MDQTTPQLAAYKPTPPLPAPKEEQEKKDEKPAHLPDTNINQVPQKKNVFLLWLISLLTLDIYTPLWYMKKSQEFYNLGTQKKIGNTIPLTLMTTNIIWVTLIIIFPITITGEMGSFYQHLSTMQMIILFGIAALALVKVFFTVLLAFYSRTIINQALENKNATSRASALFTIVFTHLYLQYEINKIIDDKEDEPKIAPWTIFLVIAVAILASIIASFL